MRTGGQIDRELQGQILTNISLVSGLKCILHYTHGQEYIWCHGEVIAIKNGKTKTIKVRWVEEHVAEGESRELYHILQDSKWNATKSQQGAWQEYLT